MRWSVSLLLGLIIGGVGACGPKAQSDGTQPPAASATVAATLAFEDVKVFDGRVWIERATVLVDGAQIVAVGPDLVVPEGAERISGQGATLLPGLIDAHTHVQTPAQLEQALLFGVTTEIDMFTLPQIAKPLRAQQAEGPVHGRADLISAGILATAPGGHGTEYGFSIPTLETPADVQRFIDDRVAEGSDFIKIVYDDGSSFGRPMPTLDRATLRAVIQAAHDRELLAVVHISSLQQAEDALEAGADGLAHLFVDAAPSEQFLGAMKDTGAFVTDTMAVLSVVCAEQRGAALADDPRVRPLLGPRDHGGLARAGTTPAPGDCQHARDTIAKLDALGVPVLASTDVPNAGLVHGASLHDELALLVDAGLSSTAALRAATAAPAEVFSQLQDRGRIAAGARADLVLVDGDPEADITATRAIRGVWKAGVAVDRDGAIERIAAQWAQVERAKAVPPPAGLAAGLIADFESGELRSEFGAGWQQSTDAMRGGASTVALRVVDGALEIKGTIDEGSLPNAWAGAMFFPGEQAMRPANLTSKPTLTFAARGDGPLMVLVFANQLGMVPAVTTVELGDQWSDHEVDLRTLVPEPYDVSAIFFGGPPRGGEFVLELDTIRLR